MQHRSCSRRAVRRQLGIGRAPFHEVRQRPDIGRHHRTHGDEKWKGADCGDRNEILERVIAQRLIDMGEYGEAGGRRQDHDGAVSRAAFQRTERETAAGAGTIVDDERRRVALHAFDEHSGNDVDRASSAEADQNARNGLSAGRAHCIGENGSEAASARQRYEASFCDHVIVLLRVRPVGHHRAVTTLVGAAIIW